jgi:hypothetical protein
MSRKQESASGLIINFQLASIRERCLSDGALTDFWRSHRLFDWVKANQKFNQHRERFERRANAEQRQQIRMLWRFHQAAKYGPALSTSWKRTRHAYFFDFLSQLPSWLEPPPGFPPPDRAKLDKATMAVLKAAQREEAWSDFALAAKLRKRGLR